MFRGKLLAMLGRAHADGRLQFFNTPRRPRRSDKRSSASSGRCATSIGSSIASRRSPGPSKCCAISRATRTASPSRTAGSSPPTTAASRSAGRTTAIDGARPLEDDDARSVRVHPTLPDPRAAEGLPSHPPLRPVRQRQSRARRSRSARELLAVARAEAAEVTDPRRPAEPAMPTACVAPGRVRAAAAACASSRSFARGATPRHRPSPRPSDQDRHVMTDARRCRAALS